MCLIEVSLCFWQRQKNNVITYFIHRHSWVRWVVVDALEIAVGFIIYLLTKVLVCFGPHLRKISWKKS